MKKLLVDGFTTKIACPTGSFRVLVVALYLQLLRNATTDSRPSLTLTNGAIRFLLMAHDGNVPTDIPFLPYPVLAGGSRAP